MGVREAIPRARRTDPRTSHVAAAMARKPAKRTRVRVWGALVDYGPMTIHEIAKRSGVDHVECARRLADLEHEGMAAPTKRVRPSPAGRPCRVWQACKR